VIDHPAHIGRDGGEHLLGAGQHGIAGVASTVAEVMQRSFSRAKIVEALEMFGVCADVREGSKTIKVQLLQFIQDQTQGSVVGDGMLVDSAPAHAPVAVDATETCAKPSTASEGLMVPLA
jgi:hypothetical protein